MSIKYESSVIFVKDIERSRRFYEDLLDQKVMMDHGPNVVYEGGFAIWQADHACEIIFGKTGEDTSPLGRTNLELYFEAEDLDDVWSDLSDSEIEIVQPLHEAPWRQRTFRFRDPDGHIVEIGEPMPVVIKRFLDEGMSPEDVSEATSMPLEFVKMVARGAGA